MIARVLIVAGSDSGGGAGIQADIKTVTALGGFAATAITALTVQNTLGVSGILPVPAEFVARQMRAVLDDIGADAIKTGMLVDARVIEAVAATLAAYDTAIPLVIDPVMIAKGGAALLDATALDSLRRLLPRATLLTPNLPEAEALLERKIASVAAMTAAARDLLATGAGAVLLKGGHLDGPIVTDILATRGETLAFEAPRIDTRHTHGTGCTLASAIATGLAQRLSLKDAVTRARTYLLEAIRQAPGIGAGHGPLDHGHPLRAQPES
jgi:hydroxymethylpyrimidine/phosphomethylpyrimidine kinase